MPMNESTANMGLSEPIRSFSSTLFPVLAVSIHGLIGYQLYYWMSFFPIAALGLSFYCFDKKMIG
jgi:hypothetical protein